MRNRCKTLLRDHSVLEVMTKACPKHYSVSAVPETLTVQEPKRPPINGGESDLRGICSTERQQVIQFQSIFVKKLVLNRGIYWLKTGIKLQKYLGVSSRKVSVSRHWTKGTTALNCIRKS